MKQDNPNEILSDRVCTHSLSGGHMEFIGISSAFSSVITLDVLFE